MPTPVEVSFIKHARGRIEGFGAMFRDRPWRLSEATMIREPSYLTASGTGISMSRSPGAAAPVTVESANGRRHLAVRGMPCASLRLLEWQACNDRAIPS
jgi:hypothetical protein